MTVTDSTCGNADVLAQETARRTTCETPACPRNHVSILRLTVYINIVTMPVIDMGNNIGVAAKIVDAAAANSRRSTGDNGVGLCGNLSGTRNSAA